MEYRIFVPEKADMSSFASRTEGFLEMLSLPDAMDELREKKILVLGAVGIGSWVALMLARHGVDRIEMSHGDRFLVSSQRSLSG